MKQQATRRRWPSRRYAVLVTVAILGSTAAGASPADAGRPDQTGRPVADLLTPPQTTEATWAELERIATTDGTVPVIVALDAPSKRPHDLTAGQLGQQNAAIARASAGLVKELGGRNLRHLRELSGLPLLAFDASPQHLRALRSSKFVRSVSLDREIEVPPDVAAVVDSGTPAPGDPSVAQAPLPQSGAVGATSWNGQSNQLAPWWNWYQVGLQHSYAAGYRGAGQTVVVLDTGVDATHPWLSSDVVAEACFLSTNACPNGSWWQYGRGAGAPCTFSTTCAHGTHVAHSAAGAWGVAPDANVIAVQVFERGPNGSPTYRESSVLWGLWYTLQMSSSYRIAAVNLSLFRSGTPFSGYCDGHTPDGSGAYITGYIETLKARGIATVIISGNDGFPNAVAHPGCISSAVTVGNTTYYDSGGYRYDAVYAGSNGSAVVDLLAPGTDICSAVPIRFDADGVDCGYIGTSMAAPHVAGAFAVLKSKRPTATVDQVQTQLVNTGQPVWDSRNGVTRSRINVYAAAYWF